MHIVGDRVGTTGDLRDESCIRDGEGLTVVRRPFGRIDLFRDEFEKVLNVDLATGKQF